ncbi:phosphatidylserine decarboxylase family protein [candidate division KSB1 bacterium]|nr:phosphatidylserine decarboxylase family protein [candidate division KSB1 bacterium]NIR70149.1 phosphatidylserine decarboxylase family protein [candidate division KSB1 bacterium]NIS28061.1 phosphatidylserine decarboxylase family protein [candidate division KSB1 bacterium]NIT74930.1 phosphatidylserine decarboxylase family protein [candidate division KSB1 bacterium]NIU28714.1 phosphatidylserine decarboxylase family protein [candidate division KSB1 bacterium]
MSREGIGWILGMVFCTGVMTTGAALTPFLHLQVLAALSFVVTGFVIFFFRDPGRAIPTQPNVVLSPADGKVIDIKDVFEDEYLKSKTTRVSIFLSLFDVHVNRIPLAGTVGYFHYRRGDFLKAYKSEASEANEQTIIGIENDKHKILFKQIAGILARRIVCDIREGNRVTLGERFGIIKFGSRVDIFLPRDVQIKVKLKEKVKGGESIIGVFANES